MIQSQAIIQYVSQQDLLSPNRLSAKFHRMNNRQLIQKHVT